jgi:hypothetical protein
MSSVKDTRAYLGEICRRRRPFQLVDRDNPVSMYLACHLASRNARRVVFLDLAEFDLDLGSNGVCSSLALLHPGRDASHCPSRHP